MIDCLNHSLLRWRRQRKEARPCVVYNNLKIIRTQCDSGAYYYNVSSASKTSIDTQKTDINTALASLTASQTSISSYKIALQKAEDSTVEQAQASVDALQSQLNDNYLTSPIDGKIIDVNIKKGQIVKKGEQIGMITLGSQATIILPDTVIIKVKEGDRVRAGESIIAESKAV